MTQVNWAGLALRHVLPAEDRVLTQVRWSPLGQKLACGSADRTIRVWNAATATAENTLRGHRNTVFSISWSPDGRRLASGSYDRTIRIWDVATGKLAWHTMQEDFVRCVAWSLDGRTIASGLGDGTIRLLQADTGEPLQILQGHSGFISSVTWSPDGHLLASSARDTTIRLWNASGGAVHKALEGHSDSVISVAWSPDSSILASSSADRTVRVWDVAALRPIIVLEGHTDEVASVAFSADGRLLASQSVRGSIRLWRSDTWDVVAVGDDFLSIPTVLGLAFHPELPLLAAIRPDRNQWAVRIWDLDVQSLLAKPPSTASVHYTNAKVVLLGDTGVGKSGLALVLTNQPFIPTESTHGRHVWTLDNREVALEPGGKETREVILWDLAGQPGYRLIHQLHLNEVAVALVVFDARSDTEPFAGVQHWDRALRQANRVQGDAAPPLTKYLVAARMDRGGVGVSQQRIAALVGALHFDRYFETSAKHGWNVEELLAAIQGVINWSMLPRVSSTELFQEIKAFLICEKDAGRLLATIEELQRSFLLSPGARFRDAQLVAEFETCIGRLESRGLIRKLSFAGLVLLQPELLDSYASAMVNSAKTEPDGLGSIPEEEARSGLFRMPDDERIADRGLERLLLIATVEDLLRHEIALREQADDGPYLVFPSELTRENPDFPDPERKGLIFRFEGPVMSVYATLAVRLAHSGVFKKKEMWKNAATYSAIVGGTCGMLLRENQEGRGELTLFFDPSTSAEIMFQFEEYVHAHLKRRALPASIERRRVFACAECGTPVSELQVRRRLDRGFERIQCGVCGSDISLADQIDVLESRGRPFVAEMDRTADLLRDHETAASILQGKVATEDFDVFLAHNSHDRAEAETIAQELRRRGLYPWLDYEQIPPGRWFQDVIQQAIPKVKSAAIIIGSRGLGRWEVLELRTFISQCVKASRPVIPVLLPGVVDVPDGLLFLRELSWVRFSTSLDDPEALEGLEWGITGRRPRPTGP